MGHLWSGRAPGRPGEPFRAIQGAHDTGANPNETRVSFFEVDIFFFFFLLSGLAWGWLPGVVSCRPRLRAVAA